MTPIEKQEIKEYLFQAIQSGKRENSDLVADILRRMEPMIATAIEKNVNGKIRDLSAKFDAYVITDTADKERIKSSINEQLEESKKWRASVTPSIEIMKDLYKFNTVFVYLLKGVILIGGAFTVVWGAIKWLK